MLKEWLPPDVVELILEKLAVKCLLRFKSVSKQWKQTIESQRFKERHMIRQGADFVFVTFGYDKAQSREIVLGSSEVCYPSSNLMVHRGSCDGLICLYWVDTPSIVINPATRWHQSFPFSMVQRVLSNRYWKLEDESPWPALGLGKDKFRGSYKPVLLYNSSDHGQLLDDDNVTTCEVFDFTTNAWRQVLPASPYRILSVVEPHYFDGSLYWLTDGEETKVISFDLHTETFQLISRAPFARVPNEDPFFVVLCILDNRLCISKKNWPTQVIWSFHDHDKTWKQMCCIDLAKHYSWFGNPAFALFFSSNSGQD